MLVVEDERRLASAVRRGLTAEGFVVDVAHDGVDGLHLAREGEYDAVVLDLMLPGLSGYQVCERLRAERNWVPVLILSAKDGEYDQADGLDLGADDYMTKPFSYVVLAARLRALLRRGARPRPAVLVAGDLHLDPDLSAVCGSVVARYSAARVPVRADATAPIPGPCVIAGDPDALSRLLVNLLDNAVRHAASQVCVSVHCDDGWAVLTVSDDGPGIPAEDTERAFGRFSRLEAARSRTGEEGVAGPAWAWPSCGPPPKPTAVRCR